METSESTDRSQSRSLDLQPSSDRLGSSSDPFSSWDGRHRSALVAATAAASAAATAASTARAAALSTKSPAPYSHGSLLTEPSSDSLTERYTGPGFTHKISHGRLGFQPVYVSHVARNPYTTNDLRSSRGPVPGSSSGPVPGSSSSPGPDSSSDPGPSSSSGPGGSPGGGSGGDPGHGPGPGSGSGQGPGGGSGQGTDLGPAVDSRHSPGHGHGPRFNFSAPVGFRNPRGDLIPNYTGCKHHCHWEPQKQSWKFLKVSEPGARGLWKPPEVEGKSTVLSETLPRGQCLLYNWEEERATNYLDQVPVMQDGSESFFFRHGHRGLLTLQPQSPMSSCTTQKDSYQPPTSHCQPIRGKREAILEMLLRQQICKEVQAEQEPTRKDFEVESVTHHDYKKELVQAGPPAPTKLHDYRTEQPETFWLERAPQLPVCESDRLLGVGERRGGGCSVLGWGRAGPVLILAFLQGVSNIRTLDTPFRKNCSFSTPAPLSLGEPLPFEPESYSQQGKISSLACQGGAQGGGGA
ncbi:PREDICTED: sperm-associated antigen 8 isoform X2 [Capra hircus]|uniref:sperm-associated antigen 8 isoform X2 n=1 Tax=Capra hircus TaxID=9925 RepID=UPI0008468AB2|nr:PREDICTED: sperm-associated antigen 8 isoform X2 [Capra hircus]